MRCNPPNPMPTMISTVMSTVDVLIIIVGTVQVKRSVELLGRSREDDVSDRNESYSGRGE